MGHDSKFGIHQLYLLVGNDGIYMKLHIYIYSIYKVRIKVFGTPMILRHLHISLKKIELRESGFFT